MVVFLCYPGVCNQAFSLFNCRDLSDGLSVLTKDYGVACSTDRHFVFLLFAGVYICCVSVGIPLYMIVLMVRRMKEYAIKSAADRFVARRVADELKLADTVAADAIRDVATGREYSFLVSARARPPPVEVVSPSLPRKSEANKLNGRVCLSAGECVQASLLLLGGL